MIRNIIVSIFIIVFCVFLLYFLVYPTKLQTKPKIKIGIIATIIPSPTIEVDPAINKLTLNSIFVNKPNLQNYPTEHLTTIAVTGDFIPARSVNYQAQKYSDFLWSTKGVKDYFVNSDIVFVNLEAPIFNNCPTTNEGFIFCGKSEHIRALKQINTTIVNLANNHLDNYGVTGYANTKDILSKNNIVTTGDTLQIIEKNNTKFAFLGYNDIGYTPNYLYKADLYKIKKDILQAKNAADIVIVQLHFGSEYNNFPDNQQVILARNAIDFGADLVVGNHPHSVQPVEIYKSKIIMYAHGNFVFDQMWSEQTKEGVIGFYTFYKKTLVKVEFKPIYITNYGKAEIPNSTTGAQIIKKLKTSSYTWKSKK